MLMVKPKLFEDKNVAETIWLKLFWFGEQQKNAEELNEHEFSNESGTEHFFCCCSNSTQNAYFETGLYVS